MWINKEKTKTELGFEDLMDLRQNLRSGLRKHFPVMYNSIKDNLLSFINLEIKKQKENPVYNNFAYIFAIEHSSTHMINYKDCFVGYSNVIANEQRIKFENKSTKLILLEEISPKAIENYRSGIFFLVVGKSILLIDNSIKNRTRPLIIGTGSIDYKSNSTEEIYNKCEHLIFFSELINIDLQDSGNIYSYYKIGSDRFLNLPGEFGKVKINISSDVLKDNYYQHLFKVPAECFYNEIHDLFTKRVEDFCRLFPNKIRLDLIPSKQ